MTKMKVYWYVLLVKTGAEERIVERLKNMLSRESCTPFVPKKTCVFRRQGKKELFQKNCFPGYVFIESKMASMEFRGNVFPIVYKNKDVYRFLHYGDRSDIAMREGEQAILSNLIGDEHKLDMSYGFKEGDVVSIISGFLKGNESRIVKLRKTKNEAVVEVAMFGSVSRVSVGLEVVEKCNRISSTNQ